MSALAAPLAQVTQGSTLWYVARASGFVTLALLTLTTCLGVLAGMRDSRSWFPFFIVDELHRSLVLVFCGFLTLHILTVLVDPFTAFHLGDVLVPFGSAYRRLWTGLGVAGAELAVAVGLSVLVRPYIGYAAWRTIHWFAYLSFPLALLHGLGDGTDTSSLLGLLVDSTCLSAVIVAVVVRVVAAPPPWSRRLRFPVLGGGAVALAALGIWTVQGPLSSGWARAAGTPDVDLVAVSSTPAPTASPLVSTPLARTIQDTVTGRITAQSQTTLEADGEAQGTVALRWALRVRAVEDNNVTGTITVAHADGTPICSGAVTGATAVGFVATCTPVGTTGSVRVEIDLQADSSGALAGGTLMVSPGAGGP